MNRNLFTSDKEASRTEKDLEYSPEYEYSMNKGFLSWQSPMLLGASSVRGHSGSEQLAGDPSSIYSRQRSDLSSFIQNPFFLAIMFEVLVLAIVDP